MIVLCAAFHNSSANSLLGLAAEWTARGGADPTYLAFGPAIETFKAAGVSAVELSADELNEAWLLDCLRRVEPAVVVIGTSKSNDGTPPIEQLITAAAARVSVPVVSLLDYIGSPQHPRYVTDGKYFLPEVIIAPDSWSKARLAEEEGLQHVRVEVLGNPQYDPLADLRREWNVERTRETRRRLTDADAIVDAYLVQFVGCVRADRIAAGCQSWDLDYVDALGTALAAIAPRLRKAIGVVARPHPRESQTAPENWRQVLERAASLGMTVYSGATLDAYETSLACDLTVISRSNFATQNMFLGVRSLSIQLDDPALDDMGLSQMGAIPVASSRDVAIEMVTSAVLDPGFWTPFDARQDRLRTENDGRSATRIAQFIREVGAGFCAGIRPTAPAVS